MWLMVLTSFYTRTPSSLRLLLQEMLRGSFVEGDTVAVTVATGSDGRATGLAFSRAAAGGCLCSIITGLTIVYCS
jgi:hypothetical protein